MKTIKKRQDRCLRLLELVAKNEVFCLEKGKNGDISEEDLLVRCDPQDIYVRPTTADSILVFNLSTNSLGLLECNEVVALVNVDPISWDYRPSEDIGDPT